MGFIIDFIRRKEQEVIGKSNSAVHKLEDDWKSFEKIDTYLVYNRKTIFLNLIKQGYNISKVPWYFFWNRKLKNNIKENIELLSKYNKIIPGYNLKFIARKKKEYADFFMIDDHKLDDDQQTAVITDDTHNLVVAGAGSGKTEVLTTRIGYLTKRKSDTIHPDRVLALAFQDKAAQEIKTRLKSRYNKDVEIRTFHSLGNKIISDASKIKGVKTPKLKPDCTEDWMYQRYIQRLFNSELMTDPSLKNEMINFMKFYGDNQIIKEAVDFKKKEEFYEYQRNLKYTALDGRHVKSEAERAILNFFIVHNLNGQKIKVLYEDPADWMKYLKEDAKEYSPKPDFYFPDFDIYHEHWAIDKRGRVPEWFSGDNPTKEYKENMKKKKEKYAEHNKYLIETTQAEFQEEGFHKILNKRFLDALKDKFPDQKFELTTITYTDLVERVWEECKESVKRMASNISKFIVIAKTYRLYADDIEKRMKAEKWSLKQHSFVKISNMIYTKYQNDLKKHNNIDFSDMINYAVDYLKNIEGLYKDVYDHILIDEFQDISKQRYELIKELMNKNKDCKLFCVGDDWQSIMGFAGSNLDFFINFDKYFPHPARTDLTKNYRSIKSIVEVGNHIIKNNKNGQIEKTAVAHSDKVTSIQLYSSLHQKKFFSQYYEQISKHCLNLIKEYHEKNNSPYDDFLVLMRIASENKIIWKYIDKYAEELKIPIIKETHVSRPGHVRFMSVHKSKGLQAKVVIILNVDKGLYGFPCELETSDIFLPAIKDNDGLREQEERRLFYVAVTRAKEEVIMYTQKCSESSFITEIKEFVKREDLTY